jgi:glutamate/aspartate transport system permease protein
MAIDFSSITNGWQLICQGAAYTFELTAITAVGGLALGTLLALCHLSRNRWISGPAKFYINMMRSIPLVMVLFWFYLLMPEVLRVILGLDRPVKIGADMTAIVTFVLFEAAYFAEIMRAGIQSVKKGQLYAAYGLGLSYWQTMRYVVLPQAVRHMLPVLLTQTIIVFQDTSLVYVLSGNDFMGAVSKIAQRDGQLVLMYSFAAVCYLAVSLSLSLLIRRVQTRMNAGQAH